MTHKIFDGQTTRDMTEEELANYETVCAERKAEADARTEAAAAKLAARKAVLDKLGLTADEAQALLG